MFLYGAKLIAKVCRNELCRSVIDESLAAKLKNQYGQQVTCIHCPAQCMELIVKDTICHSQILQTTFSTLKHLFSFLGVHPKWVKVFKDLQKMNQIRDQTVDDIACILSITSSIKSLSQTCWTAGASAAKVVVDKQRKLEKNTLNY